MEEWKDIKGYEGHYQVSNLGNVRSLKRNKVLKLKIVVDGRGYCVVTLHNKGQKIRKVHQLVAESFLNYFSNKNRFLVVDHIDNNKKNNKLDNLQIISCRKNVSKDVKGKTSIYTGVCKHKQHKNWYSQIKINGKTKYLGLFNCETSAHIAYLKKLKEFS